jgi:two-component system OmpR family sensor kinase
MMLRGRFSIFTRTFLLMLAALIVAEAVGVALLLTRPPMRNAPVRLSEVARQLSGVPFGFPRFSPSGERGREFEPPAGDRGHEPEPPAGEHGHEFEPPPGFPPGPPLGMRQGGMQERFHRADWEITTSATPPVAPKDQDVVVSQQLTGLLAQRLGVARERVRVFVAEEPLSRGRFDDDPQLREGFTAAWQRDSGDWRVLHSVAEGFPNAFQRQAMWLFAIGALLMLPAAWFFARALAAPLHRFALGAERLGTDPHAPQLPPSGPPEMQSAIDSFNAMQSRITRLLEERSQMIGAIAHDLRTPLMRLSFRLDGLEPPLKEKVESDIQEMKLMISAALDFLRDQAARRSRERLDLRLLVESVVDDQADVGHDARLLEAESAAAVPIEGDPVALRRLLVNVMDNALKYGERARVRLRVQGSNAFIEVDDDGPGIPEALQQRVFDPFFRAESSRNRETGGIGLGLTTVRAIALDHGGSIELRNRKEGGLRVIVSLPLPGQ